jgi:hypothetical protein
VSECWPSGTNLRPDPELRECTADLGRLRFVDLAAALRCEEVMRAPVGIICTVRIPTIATTRSDGSRPPVPIDRDQSDSAVRCIC